MDNKFYNESSLTREEYKNYTNPEKFIQMAIDGRTVHQKEDLLHVMEYGLAFPGECKGKISRLTDWLCDLSWYPEDLGICLRIHNYGEFLNQDPVFKQTFEELMTEHVLPFWEDDVKTCVKDGKPRKFFVIIS